MDRIVRAGALGLAFAPLLAAALLVSAYAVDVPLADDWARAALFEGEGVDRTASLAPLPLLPRLAARANARFWGGDLTLTMALGFAWVVVSALCVHGLLRRTFADDPLSLYTTTFVANLLLFSPVQWEGFLWAARAGSFFPFAAVSLALFVVGSRAPRAAKAGVVVVLTLAWGGSVSLPAASGGAAGLAGLLGHPFARTPLAPLEDLAPLLGAAVAALFAVGAGACLRDAGLRARAVPWLVLGGFALGVGILIVVAAGPDGVLLSRYATPGLTLCLAAVPLLGLSAAGLRSRVPASQRLLEWLPAFGTGILLVAIGIGWLAGVRGMQEWRSARLQARTSLVFLDRFAPVHLVRLGGDTPLGAVREAARVLDRHGQLRPGLASDDGFGPFAPDGGLAELWGDVESAWVSGSGLELTGFAWLPEAERRADGVLVTARVADGPRRVIAVAELEAMPLPPIPEHDHIYNHARVPGADEEAPWRVRISADALPEADAVRIEAFAADAETLRLHRLAHEVELRRTPTGLNARLRRAAP